MEIVCLDTNILIEHKRTSKSNKRETALFKLAAKGYQFAVTSITVFELLRGTNTKEDAFWNDFFDRVILYDFDSEAATVAGSIYRKLKKQGGNDRHRGHTYSCHSNEKRC